MGHPPLHLTPPPSSFSTSPVSISFSISSSSSSSTSSTSALSSSADLSTRDFLAVLAAFFSIRFLSLSSFFFNFSGESSFFLSFLSFLFFLFFLLVFLLKIRRPLHSLLLVLLVLLGNLGVHVEHHGVHKLGSQGSIHPPVDGVHVVVEPSDLLRVVGGDRLHSLLVIAFHVDQVGLLLFLVVEVPGLALLLLVHVLLQVSALSVVVHEHPGQQLPHLLMLFQDSLVERLQDGRSREQDGQSQPQD